MLALGLVVILFGLAALAPESPVGQVLIRAPARFLAWLTPWRALMGLLPVFVVIGLVVSGLELVALLGLADFSLLVMVGVPALALGVRAQLTILRQRIVKTVTRIVVVGRTMVRPAKHERPRRRRIRPPLKPDDADGPGWAWA